jgi:FrmR/RcnR family transcriptional regulator, repressor of rcnA expression
MVFSGSWRDWLYAGSMPLSGRHATALDFLSTLVYPTRYPIYSIPPTLSTLTVSTLSHTKSEKAKLLNRIRRVRGQIEAVERALEEEKGCATVLHLIVAARGAMNSLMTEVIEDHIRLHVVDPVKDAERTRGAEELIEAVQAYLK